MYQGNSVRMTRIHSGIWMKILVALRVAGAKSWPGHSNDHTDGAGTHWTGMLQAANEMGAPVALYTGGRRPPARGRALRTPGWTTTRRVAHEL